VRSSVPRAVLDTNVLVSALISPGGGSARLLLELRSGAFELLVSPLLLAELREVLRRDTFRQYVSEAEADAYFELIRSEGVLRADPRPSPVPLSADPRPSPVPLSADPRPSPVPLSADPDDEYLIDLARDAGANALVSGDTHLLELRAIIPAMTPAEFLEMLPGR
jgi:predicted nucleic acid-binding protein